MPETEDNTTSLDRTAAGIAVAAVVLGVAVRIWVLSQRGSFFLDEASLALNVLGRDFVELARPLDWGQAAPVGFLWVLRALTLALGSAEWVLRLLPFVAGALTPWLAWRVGRRLVGDRAAMFAAVALACSLLAIRYSAEAKPYATDALATLVLIGAAVRVRAAPSDVRGWYVLGALGVGAIVLSLPSVFVLATVGFAIGDLGWRGGSRVRVIALASGALWLATFGALWLLVVRESSGGAYLREYWAPVMLDVGAPDFVARAIRAVASFAATPLSWTGSVVVAIGASAAWLVGVVVVARRDARAAVLLAGPALLAACASMLGVYPLSDRLAFFVAPAALIASGAAVAWVVEWLVGGLRTGANGGPGGADGPGGAGGARGAGGAAPRRLRAATWLVAVAVGAWVGHDAWRMVRAPGSLEPTRELFQAVFKEADADAVPVYIHARAIPAWVYATTDWRAPDRARLARYVVFAGHTDSPAHENLSRAGPVEPGAGDSLRIEAPDDRLRAKELVGLAPGVRYRIAGPTSADAPSAGWATEEARRISADVARGGAWIVASHFFEGTSRDELRPLIEAVRAAGLNVVEERRAGRDAIALRAAPDK